MNRLCICAFLVTITTGCEFGTYDHEAVGVAATDKAPAKTPAATVAPVKKVKNLPPVPLAKGGAAASVLADLHQVGADLTPQVAACTKLPPEVSSFVSSISSQAKLLHVRIGAGATTHSLNILAGTLRGGVDAVSQRTPERAELRRLQGELTASVRDIAETFGLLAEKLSGQDMLAVEHARARLRNAAGNYVTTVRTLVSECAPG